MVVKQLEIYFQKILFRLRYGIDLLSLLRKTFWQMQGARIGHGTRVPRMLVTWPQQLNIGRMCNLEDDIFFKYDGIWNPGPSINVMDNVFIGRGCEFNIRLRIDIGNDCLIASGCKFVDHDHEMTRERGPMRKLPCPEASIVLHDDVWLGVNVVVLKGVTIGTGAIVAASAVVTKSIAPFEIWAGIPARKIGERPLSA